MTTEEILLQANESLMKVNEQQSRRLIEQGNQIAELTAEIKKMAAQIAWFQQQMFGRRSERHLPEDNQPSLFDAAGVEIPGESLSADECEEETVTYTRKKSQKGVSKPRETWENLPLLETRVIEPQDVDLTRYRRIGEEVTTLVGFEPGRYYRIAVVRPKYGLIDPTEPVERGKGVIIAPAAEVPRLQGCARRKPSERDTSSEIRIPHAVLPADKADGPSGHDRPEGGHDGGMVQTDDGASKTALRCACGRSVPQPLRTDG